MLNIPRNQLKIQLQDITPEEAIQMLNSIPVIKVGKVNKGTHGETSVGLSINNFIVEERTKHAGDMVIWKENYPHIKIMIEVKNYSGTIPESEYQKLIDDIEYNQFTGGILVANQDIRGVKPFEISGGRVYVNSHDQQLVNITCEMLWAKLFERQHYKMIDTEGQITIQCNVLASCIERLASIKGTVELIRKNNEKLLKKITDEVDSNISDMRKVINKVIRQVSQITTTIETRSKIKLPAGEYFHDTVPAVRERIEEIIEKLYQSTCPYENALVSQTKNKYEINLAGRKIFFEFFKTKLEIKFKPAHMNFGEYPGVDFIGGLVVFEINKSNFLQTPKIIDFW